jgi:hypothetical protein
MTLERTQRTTANAWRWFRQDPAMASALQAVLLTGEGGDIIAAMRAMSPQSVIETVALAFGDLCDEAGDAYRSSRRKADQWAFWQLLLGVTTVGVILLSLASTFLSLSIAAASTSAVSFITGSATIWFDRQVEGNRKEADARFQDMVRYCTQSKLIVQLGVAMDGLDPEQQEKLIAAVLGLRV